VLHLTAQLINIMENIMRKLKATFIALATAVPLLAFSLPSQAAMSPYMKTALVDVCKAAMSNKVHRLYNTSKSYHLKDKTIALKVMCNGDDIITFAERHGADKTAAKLQRSIGSVNIIDTAAISKINVNFTE
jgi:ribosomal protein S17